MKHTHKLRRWMVAIAVAAGCAIVASPVRATFPGRNGDVAYRVFSSGEFQQNAIYLGSRQVTFPSFPSYDFAPALSRDGQRVAFVRQSNITGFGYYYQIMVVGTDGRFPRTVAASESFPGVNTFSSIGEPTWGYDGRLSFSVRNGSDDQNGIWTIGAIGGGLGRTVAEKYSPSPAWSPIDQELAYACTFRQDEFNSPMLDLCIWDDGTKKLRQVQIDPPGQGSSRGSNTFGFPEWTPDGERILFHLGYATSEGGRLVNRVDIFSVGADGRGLTKLTDSGPDICPATTSNGWAAFAWETPSPSPDGGSFVAVKHTNVVVDTLASCRAEVNSNELDIVSMKGGKASVLVGTGAGVTAYTDWQAIPGDLIVDVDDGHEHPLKGLKLELKMPSSGTLVAVGENTADGTYVFTGVLAGPYTLRATLTDNDGATPAFDIRHNPEPSTPAWIETPVTVKPGKTTPTELHFANSPALTATSVGDSANRERLSDMAAIYWRVRQYVDWVKANLTPTTGARVEYYTFAQTDPILSSGVAPDAGYYVADGSYVVFGPDFSVYGVRDGVSDGTDPSRPLPGDEAPENGEWHEFSHHLYHTFINSQGCGDFVNHGGWTDNDNTCDSMNEGLSAFLPAFAAHDILGTSDSDYDGKGNLETLFKAWTAVQLPDKIVQREDLAVAALLWDLTDGSADVEDTEVIGQDRLRHEVSYVDTQEMTLQALWSTLTSPQPLLTPVTVRDLRLALGFQAPTLDLDSDLLPDVAPIDEVFLMHGFFPVDDQQLSDPEGTTFAYDVDTAQRGNPSVPRNAAVGLSDHYTFFPGGSIWQTFFNRPKLPAVEGANLSFTVTDASGRPLSGATVDLDITYAGVSNVQTRTAKLGTGNGALVPLELPPYYDYPLFGGALPACNPATDVRVDVSVTTRLNGYVSPDTATFDNCDYFQALAATTGPAALSFTSTFPDDGTPPVSTVITSPTDVLVDGATYGEWIVRLVCDDPVVADFASGCDRIEYSLDGGPLTTYQQRIVIGGVGSHSLQYRSVDAAGNQEAPQTVDLDVAQIPAPTITGFSPTTAIFGTPVAITGTDLDRTTSVTFNGLAAVFTIMSATQVTAAVPTGATTGPITVTTTGGMATTTANIVVMQPPTITSFSPASGNAGTLITVRGTNFETTHHAFINGSGAGWRVDSPTQLTVLVLDGTTTGPIEIQTEAGTATSATNFIVGAPPTTTTTSTTSTTTVKGHKTTTTTTSTTRPSSTTTATSSTTTTTRKGKTTTTTRSPTTTTTVTSPSTSTTTTVTSPSTSTTVSTCRPTGVSCGRNSDCCSGSCPGKTKTCK